MIILQFPSNNLNVQNLTLYTLFALILLMTLSILNKAPTIELYVFVSLYAPFSPMTFFTETLVSVYMKDEAYRN